MLAIFFDQIDNLKISFEILDLAAVKEDRL